MHEFPLYRLAKTQYAHNQNVRTSIGRYETIGIWFEWGYFPEELGMEKIVRERKKWTVVYLLSGMILPILNQKLDFPFADANLPIPGWLLENFIKKEGAKRCLLHNAQMFFIWSLVWIARLKEATSIESSLEREGKQFRESSISFLLIVKQKKKKPLEAIR